MLHTSLLSLLGWLLCRRMAGCGQDVQHSQRLLLVFACAISTCGETTESTACQPGVRPLLQDCYAKSSTSAHLHLRMHCSVILAPVISGEVPVRCSAHATAHFRTRLHPRCALLPAHAGFQPCACTPTLYALHHPGHTAAPQDCPQPRDAEAVRVAQQAFTAAKRARGGGAADGATPKRCGLSG